MKKYCGADERRGRVRRTVGRHHHGGARRLPVRTGRVARRCDESSFPTTFGYVGGVVAVNPWKAHDDAHEPRTSWRCCWPAVCCRGVRLSVGGLQNRGSSDGRRWQRRPFGRVVRTERKRTWSVAVVRHYIFLKTAAKWKKKTDTVGPKGRELNFSHQPSDDDVPAAAAVAREYMRKRARALLRYRWRRRRRLIAISPSVTTRFVVFACRLRVTTRLTSISPSPTARVCYYFSELINYIIKYIIIIITTWHIYVPIILLLLSLCCICNFYNSVIIYKCTRILLIIIITIDVQLNFIDHRNISYNVKYEMTYLPHDFYSYKHNICIPFHVFSIFVIMYFLYSIRKLNVCV